MEERGLIDYWLVLYRRKGIILLMLLVAVAGAVALSAVLSPIYEARVVMFVPKEPETVSFFSPDAAKTIAPKPALPPTEKKDNAPYLGMLRSMSVMQAVVDAYPQLTVQQLRRDADVEMTNEFLLAVYVRNRDPKVAANLANAFHAALNEVLRGHFTQALEVQTTIEKRLVEAKLRRDVALKALQAFDERRNIADLGIETTELIRQRSVFEAKVEDTKADLQAINQRIQGVRQQLEREAALYIPTELITTNPLVEALKKDLADLEANIRAKTTELGDRHPDLVAARAQYQTKKQELAREVSRIIESQTKDVASFHENLRRTLANLFVDKIALEARIKGLGRTISELEGRMATLPELRSRRDQLVTEVNISQNLVLTLTTNLEEAKAQGARYFRGAILVDQGQPPARPVFPIPWLNGVVAGVLGIVGGIFYAFLLDYIETSLAARRRRELLSSPVASALLHKG